MKNIFIVTALLLLMSCGSKENSASHTDEHDEQPNHLEMTDVQLKNMDLSTTQVQERTIVQTLRLNGQVDVPPQNLVSVSAALGGYLKSTKLLPGYHFEKGEVLAVMEDNQYIQIQQDYLSVKAQLIAAQAEYHRQKELNQSKATSDKAYQQAKAAYEMLEVNKAALEQKLRLINIQPEKLHVANISRSVKIYAPFDGYVTKVMVNVGKYLSPSDVMFELVDPTDLHLNLKVFEKDWDKIKLGEKVVSYTNSHPEKKHHGELILIGKNISDDRAVETHAHFERYDPSLIPGMYMNAEIEVPSVKVWALPDASIVTFEGKNFVFKQESKNSFELIEVKTGASGRGWTIIENPQALQGAKIVEKGAYTLLMALKNTGEHEH